MRYFFYLLFILFFVGSANAQTQVKVVGDTVMVNETPFCLIRTTGGTLKHYSVYTLNLDELVYCKPILEDGKHIGYSVLFLESGVEGQVPADKNFKQQLGERLYRDEMIESGKIPMHAAKFFADRYNAATLRASLPTSNPEIRSRDREKDIFILPNEIKQDNVIIGIYDEGAADASAGAWSPDELRRNSKQKSKDDIVRYRVLLPSGKPIAEIKMQDVFSKQCILITNQDKKIHNLTVENYKFAMFTVAKYLVEQNYL